MFSGNNRADVQPLAEEAGVDLCLNKPVPAAELERVLSTLLQDQT